jgi:hypothetical protein
MTHLGQMVRRDCRKCGPESLSDGNRCLLCGLSHRTAAPKAPKSVAIEQVRSNWSSTGVWEPDAAARAAGA